MYDYDLLVLGSGPGGQKAAIAAAKLDRRVAIVERRHMMAVARRVEPRADGVGVAVDRRALFTYPDITDNRMFMAIARGERPLAAAATLSGVAFYRASRIATVNGDQADWLACQDPARAGFVCTADAAGGEAPVLNDAGDAVPFDGADPYNAAANTTRTRQEGYGAAAQLSVRPRCALCRRGSDGVAARTGWLMRSPRAHAHVPCQRRSSP